MVPTNQISSTSSSTATTSPPSSSFSLTTTSASSTSVVASTSTMVNTNTSSSITDVDIFDSEEYVFDKMRIGSASTKSYGLSSSYSFPSVPSVTSLANFNNKDGPGKDKTSLKANKGSEQKKSSSSKLNDSFSSSHTSLVSNQISMASTTSSTTLTPTIASTSPSSSISSPVSNSQIYSISSSPTIVNSDGHPLRQYSRSHQRRFHRRFPAVDQHEKLIDWYSCALVADILLQGYLYISENYFAFYSNILGYKTQLLIPMCDVISVTKEKTAKIFPNAVGICTDQTKYVFGSLLSRESTFRLMQEVWKSTLIQVVSLPYFSPVMQLDKIIQCESDILIEKPENAEREEDIEEAESAASMTEESLTNNNQSSLIFAKIKPALPEAIKLVSSEIPSIQQILSSTHQETDSSGSDSEANRDTSAIFQDSNKNLINEAKSNPQKSYGSRLIIKTKNWLITFIQPCQQLIWNQITDTTRLLLMTTTLLVMLFLSALIFLYRVEQVHSELLTLQQNTEPNDFNQVQLKQIELRKEIKRLVNLLEKKTMELTVLKERIEEILNSFNHLSTCS